MDIFKIVGLGCAAAAIAVVIKGQRPEIAMQISLLCSITIFLLTVPHVMSVVKIFEVVCDKFNIDIKNIQIVLKIIGIAYVAQFGGEICRDVGENAIASKVEFAGKVIITALSIPIIYSLINMVVGVMY